MSQSAAFIARLDALKLSYAADVAAVDSECAAEIEHQLAAQRERIAAAVDAMGCRCFALGRLPVSGHTAACPCGIAAAIREGGIG
jgi:hypothetical protein